MSFEATCGDSFVLVGINRLLDSEAGTYFLLFAPIGDAGVRDVPPNGLEVFVRYPIAESICSVRDITISSEGSQFLPTSAEEALDRAASCSYQFSVPLSESGKVALRFHRSKSCAIPDLLIKYKTNTKHHYDSIQG